MRHILLLLAMATLFACTGPAPDEAKPEAMAASQETSHNETQEAEDSHKAHWGYGETDGPEMWSSLSPDFALCAEGTTQSPIDLTGAATGDNDIELRKNLPPVSMTFVRKEHIADILDNGHSLQVTYDEAATAELNGKAYSLAQLHFHAPSEHTIDGQSFPMENPFCLYNRGRHSPGCRRLGR